MTLEQVRQHRCFGGTQAVYRHLSEATGTPMEFAIFLPPQVETEHRPVLTYLSGLTCTWANVTEKGGAQRYAAEHGLVLVCPDTSPRGTDLPGEHESYDFGSGARRISHGEVMSHSHLRRSARVRDVRSGEIDELRGLSSQQIETCERAAAADRRVTVLFMPDRPNEVFRLVERDSEPAK